MANKKESTQQPALMLMFSNASNNVRPLNRDATIIGRARNADIVLDAADISTLHCVITHNSGGFTVRDCGSRAGVRINGDNVTEGTLHDGDVFQVGPFSFKVVIPPREHSSGLREARARHHELSRRNLARLALSLRHRLREKGITPRDVTRQPEYQRDLGNKASGLRMRVQDYERRLAELELAEREVSEDRDLLNKEFEALNVQTQRSEQEIARRREEVESQLRTRHVELKQLEAKLREEEARQNTERERLTVECKKEDRAYLVREIEDLRARAQRTDQELARRRSEFESQMQARQLEFKNQEERLAQEAVRLVAERDALTAERQQLDGRREQVNTQEHRFAAVQEQWQHQREELEQLAARLQQALTGIHEFHNGSPARAPENARFVRHA